MAELDLDLITVDVVREEELSADRADLFLTIQGLSLVTGNQALKRAKEVAQLVAALTQQGLPEQDVHLEGVSVEMTGGIVKTSQATYHLRVRCARLDMLGDILGVVAAQKNITLGGIVWGYGDGKDERDRWLEECAVRAHEKARRIASGLGVTLTGVHRFSEKTLDPETEVGGGMDRLRSSAPMQVKRRAEYDLGLEVSHKKRITLQVQVEYRVSGYEGG